MGRIRSIKPEFPHSESMGKVSRDARLLFVLMWTIADDSGRLRGSSRMLASLLFPYDDDAPKHIDKWIDELAREGCIDRYHASAATYIQIRKWLEHQRIDKPTPSRIPAFDESSRGLQEDSRILLVGLEGIGREGIKEGAVAPDNQEKPNKAKPPERPEDVSEEVWADWLQLRKSKKAPVNQTVLKGLRAEGLKADFTLERVMATCVQNGWQGFDATWKVKSNGTVAPRLVAMSTQHVPNMPLGAANCQCQECVNYRAKRTGT